MRKGTHGAKPDAFNDWILNLIGYQEGDSIMIYIQAVVG